MNALVIYQSKNGSTRQMAEEIATELKNNNIQVKVGSIQEIHPTEIEKADRLYMGCWTSGLIFLNQKPDNDWKRFVAQLPIGTEKKTMMFTTYKVATGSMFKNMRRNLKYRGLNVSNNALKSKTGNLTDLQRNVLLQSLN